MTVTEEARHLATTLYNFHRIPGDPRPAGAIVALGSNDIRVAAVAADLYLRSFAPVIVFSGGIAHQTDLLSTGWREPEAEVFAAAAEGLGVPRRAMILEPRSTNTAENFRFTRQLIDVSSIVVAVKPFMRRRARATLVIEWPEVEATYASPDLSFDQFCADGLGVEDTINILVGDTQRLDLYAQRGWIAPEPLTPEASDAYERLIALGFTRHLIEDQLGRR